ncbi:MAG: DUF4878 domain-containing protein [Oscillospiraceae bacterium]|nr:DUF4878 domain-containing protein [Oscillospiraceae bacterium]
MKKIISIVLALVFVLSISACGAAKTPKPEDTVKEFCEAMKSMDWDKMGSLCVGDRFNSSSFEEFETSAPFLADYMKENIPKTEYTINAASVDEDTATVTVNFKYINGYLIVREAAQNTMQNILGMALTGAVNEDDLPDVFNQYMSTAIKDAQENLGNTTKETDVQFTLSKEDGKWMISDFDDEFSTILSCNTLSALDDLS